MISRLISVFDVPCRRTVVPPEPDGASHRRDSVSPSPSGDAEACRAAVYAVCPNSTLRSSSVGGADRRNSLPRSTPLRTAECKHPRRFAPTGDRKAWNR